MMHGVVRLRLRSPSYLATSPSINMRTTFLPMRGLL